MKLVSKITVVVVALGAAISFSTVAPDAEAADPCDSLPTQGKKWGAIRDVSDSLCNVACGDWPQQPPALKNAKPTAPVRPGGFPGASLEYHDQWHGACRLKVGPVSFCSMDTTCAPGQSRFQDGGVWKCQSTKMGFVSFNPQAECRANVPPPPLDFDANIPRRASREKDIMGPKGKKVCTIGGNANMEIKGANLHFVDAVKSDDPAIKVRPWISGQSTDDYLNTLRIHFDVDNNARLGDHDIELSAWNGRSRKVLKVQVFERPEDSCPVDRSYAGPKMVCGCTNNGACPTCP